MIKEVIMDLTTKFAKSLTQEKRKEFSRVIDEIERRTYFETKRSILNGLKKAYDNNGGLRGLYDNLIYRLNKPDPFIKEK